MKTIRFFGVALLSVLMSVGFSACSSSDDDSNGGDTSASIEGTWKKISEKEYVWDKENNKPDFDKCQYTDYRNILYSFSKKGKNLLVTSHQSGNTSEWFYISGNEYYFTNSKGEKSHQVIIKELTKEQLIIYVRDHYFTGGGSIVIVQTYVRQ